MGRKAVTNEEIAKIAQQFKTRAEFAKRAKSKYNLAAQRDILDKVCAHMVPGQPIWTLEAVQAEAQKYRSKGDFRNGSRGAYEAAKRDFDCDAICAHMPTARKTKAELQAIVCRYTDLKTFRESENAAYLQILRQGFAKELLGGLQRKYRNWSDEELFEEARKYNYSS